MGRRRRLGMARGGGSRRGRPRPPSKSDRSENKDPKKLVQDDEDNKSSEPVRDVTPQQSTSMITNYSREAEDNLLTVDDIFPMSMVPDVDGEDIVLNRRGTPIRTKKQSWMYYDSVKGDSSARKARTPTTTASKNRKRMEELNVKQEPIKVETKKLTKKDSTCGTTEISEFRTPAVPKVSSNLKKVKRIALPPRPFNRRLCEDTTNGSSDDHGSGTEQQTSRQVVASSSKSSHSEHPPPPPLVVVNKKVQVATERNQKRTKDSDSSSKNAPGTPPLLSMPDLSSKEMKSEPTSPPSKLPFPLISERDRSQMMDPEDVLNYPSSLPLASCGTGNKKRQSSQQHEPLSEQQQQHQNQKQEDLDKQAKVRGAMVANQISQRLRNMIKLPKAHRWVCFEWFYGDVDRAILLGVNDFQLCLRESFPELKTRMLTRTEWSFIRRTMGKPRRCSDSFFKEEREELDMKRRKMRMVQRRAKLPDDWTYKDLPDLIPLSIRVGSKVTAKLRHPQDGIFNGTVQGWDLSNNTYRIRFDRNEIGTLSIIDYEVMSVDPPEMFPVSTYTMKLARHGAVCGNAGAATEKSGLYMSENALLQYETLIGIPRSPFPADGMLGGFPIRLLEIIVRFSKLLKAKREKNFALAKLNVEAEKVKAYGKPYSKELKTRYAKCIQELGEMNKTIGSFMHAIQIYCNELPQVRESPSSTTIKLLNLDEMTETANLDAAMIVSTYNCKGRNNDIPRVYTSKITSLVEQMASLLLQVRALAAQTGDRKAFELIKLHESVQKMKISVEGKNLEVFENKIELPMKRIAAGLCVRTKPPTNDTAPKRYIRGN